MPLVKEMHKSVEKKVKIGNSDFTKK